MFGSGQAAATAVLMTVLRPGDTLAMAADGYYGVRHLVNGHLAGFGIAVTRAPTAGPGLARIARDATLVWLETPEQPRPGRLRRRGDRRRGPRRRRAGGGQQHHPHAARPAPARARRRPVDGVRHQVSDRPLRPHPGPRRDPRPRPAGPPARLAHHGRRDRRRPRRLARPPVARHARRPPRARLRQRPGRGRGRPPGARPGPGALPGHARRPLVRARRPPDAARGGRADHRPRRRGDGRGVHRRRCGSSSTPPASAASAPAPSGAPAGAATTSRRAWCG